MSGMKTPRKCWTVVEDEKLRSMIPYNLDNVKWKVIARKMEGRTTKQCRERYLNHLRPGIKKSCWSREEDNILKSAHVALGNQWKEIAKLLPGRAENSVKNRWHILTRKERIKSLPSNPCNFDEELIFNSMLIWLAKDANNEDNNDYDELSQVDSQF